MPEEKVKILVVDDTPANRLAFFSVLNAPGFEILLADGGSEALRLALEHDFAVILLDIRMPGMDGVETAIALRNRDRTKHTPLIFMSAYEKLPAAVMKGQLSGAIDHLFSPVDEGPLRRKVAAFVDLYLQTSRWRLENERLARTNEALQRQVAELTAALQATQR